MLEYNFFGKHLIAEYYGLDYKSYAKFENAKDILLEAIELAGVTCVDIISEQFEPMGYTIVAALLESHISLHAYPEHQAMFIDVFTCGDKNPNIIHEHLIKELGVKEFEINLIERGR